MVQLLNLADTGNGIFVEFAANYRRNFRWFWVRMFIRAENNRWLIDVQRFLAPPDQDPAPPFFNGERFNVRDHPFQVGYLISPDVLLQFTMTYNCLQMVGTRDRPERRPNDALSLRRALIRPEVRELSITTSKYHFP